MFPFGENSKIFSRFGTKSSDYSLSSRRRIFHPVQTGNIRAWAWVEGMIITRENLLERCTLITFTVTLCYQQLCFSFYDLYLLNDRMNIFTVEDRTVYSLALISRAKFD